MGHLPSERGPLRPGRAARQRRRQEAGVLSGRFPRRAGAPALTWEFVRQPNGLLARFDERTDAITHANLNPVQAERLARELLSPDEVADKLRGGLEDWTPWALHRSSDGLSRWRDALGRVERAHGPGAVAQILAAIAQVPKATQPTDEELAGLGRAAAETLARAQAAPLGDRASEEGVEAAVQAFVDARRWKALVEQRPRGPDEEQNTSE